MEYLAPVGDVTLDNCNDSLRMAETAFGYEESNNYIDIVYLKNSQLKKS